MNAALLLLLFQTPSAANAREAHIAKLIESISESGRVLQSGETRRRLEDPKKQVPPGQPPILSFRYFAGVERHRFGKLDLMLDDAGH